MVKTIVSPSCFRVTVGAFDSNSDEVFAKVVPDLTFMQASDYANHAANYFRFALLEHSGWYCVQIEVANLDTVFELTEITRDQF